MPPASAREAGGQAAANRCPGLSPATMDCRIPAALDITQGRSRPNRVASNISETRRRQILAVLLAAFGLLTLASLATWEPPYPATGPWTAANACGPVGATLAYGLIWAFGRFASFGVPLLAGFWVWTLFRSKSLGRAALTSAIGALLLFEVCVLLGLSGLERWTWAGGWGFAAALA